MLFFVLSLTLIQPPMPSTGLLVWDLDPIFCYIYTFMAAISTIFLAKMLLNTNQHFTFQEQSKVNIRKQNPFN
ncbi:hypothetical protein yfred0001_40300 [Yersinia frederiksenii ATCC 33641]|nr:hypothetical protein CRN75_07215 [Yersinia frederiksenii]EEQ13923.1 hypothetical protein yfred0001_40300 [Yersinia frederiksenii ATCC 33641]